MINFSHYLLTAWRTEMPFYLLLDWDVDVLTEKFSDLLTLTWCMTEWMTCLDCIVLVDCMFVSWCIYCELYDESQIFLALPKLPWGGDGGSGGMAVRYYLSAPRYTGSFESQSISFEAGRVVRIRKQPFRVLIWHTRNHLVLTVTISKEN